MITTNKASPPTPLLKERVDRVEDERRERLLILHSLKLKAKAKYLRVNMTREEKLLWKKLRAGRVLGYKFRRQFPIDNYILDFFCFEKLLAIELDGSQHNDIKIAEYDRMRTTHLESYNIRVIRFQNKEVRNNIKEVLNTIYYNLQLPYSSAV